MAWTDSFQLGRSVYDPKRYRLDFRFDASCTPSILGYLLLSLYLCLSHSVLTLLPPIEIDSTFAHSWGRLGFVACIE